MKTININEQQIKNLFLFLERTDLKGKEVSAFNELINIISEIKDLPEQEKLPTKKK